ncbi:hypothetical protein [Lichenifustis flavocetrariae]|uniref:Uncharacterized protein n=1 Tax=Lichenifustis flavocetrariae TaxID=2949735 RepID=A0AA41Z5A6_9HYPH|nr:hypothetical protein [Lichenifustis flavocetrariae]MCW6513228.1 hypothetical protein [Lichenifustis flavocetrariae]
MRFRPEDRAGPRMMGDFEDGYGVGWWFKFEIIGLGWMVDGPVRSDGFAEKALGRIVGVMTGEEP